MRKDQEGRERIKKDEERQGRMRSDKDEIISNLENTLKKTRSN